MTKGIWAISISVLMLFSFSLGDAYGAAFVKFDGVDGEATDDGHTDWINLLSFSQSITREGVSGASGSTRTTGDATFEDISIAITVDKASPKLALACADGKRFDTVDIHLTRGDSPTTYYAYELKNVLITSFQVNGVEPSPDIPTENLSLNYEEIKVLYTEFDPSSGEPSRITGYECNLDKKGNECNEVDIPIVPTPASFDTNTALEIPEWFNTNLEWYKSGLISELEMYDNIFYLLDKEIIHT